MHHYHRRIHSFPTRRSSDLYSASPSLSGSVTLTPTTPAVNITITPVDDSSYEGAENLTLTLQPGTGYNLGGTTTATVSIADRKSTRLNSSHLVISYAVFCLK